MNNKNLLIEIYKNFNDKMLDLSHKYFTGMYKESSVKVFKSHLFIYNLIRDKVEFDKKKYYRFVFEEENYNETKTSSLLNRHLKHLKEIVIISLKPIILIMNL